MGSSISRVNTHRRIQRMRLGSAVVARLHYQGLRALFFVRKQSRDGDAAQRKVPIVHTLDESIHKKRWLWQALLGGGILVVVLVGVLFGFKTLAHQPGPPLNATCPSAPRSVVNGSGSPAPTASAGSGAIEEFAIPTALAGPTGLTVGPDGTLWFTEQDANQIGRLTPQGHVSEYPLAHAPNGPAEITAGPDRNLWFTQPGANQIGRITPQGVITEFSLPTPLSGPWGITAGPDGNLWFTERAGTHSKIGRITPQGVITEFSLPPLQDGASGDPITITSGPNETLWLTNGNSLGRITTTGTVTLFPLPDPSSYTYGLTASPDGTLWFSVFPVGHISGQIGCVSGAGTISFPLSISFEEPSGVTMGADGALWFTEYGGAPALGNRIWRLQFGAHQSTVQGLSAFPIKTPWSEPQDILAGADGTLWFTEHKGNHIGHLLPGRE